MNVLLIIDSFIDVKNVHFSNINSEDVILLFSLTSNSQINNYIEDKLKKNNYSVAILRAAELVNSSAILLRENYLKFIAELPNIPISKGRNLKQLFAVDEFLTLWWLSLISEKNTFKSDSFHKLVQLDAIICAIKNYKIKQIQYGCNSPKMEKALIKYIDGKSIGFTKLATRERRIVKHRVLEFQKYEYMKHLLHLLYFFVRNYVKEAKIKANFASMKCRSDLSDNELLIITYYPNFNILSANKGIFRNKFYPFLQEALRTLGKNIVWVALEIHDNSISFNESLKYAASFNKQGHSIYFLREFNSIFSQLRALFRMILNGIRFLRVEKNIALYHRFSDYNFYSIMREDWYKSFVGIVGYDGLLYYDMFKTMLRRFNPKKCLYYCEMQAWEKALSLAKLAIKNDSLLLGYQHATVSKMLLNYFNHPSEIDKENPYNIPQPNKILCNGKIPYEYMKKSGWPEAKLSIVEAIRYNYLKKYLSQKWTQKGRTVLVAFSINLWESSAILNTVLTAFEGMEDIELLIKTHPSLPINQVLELSGTSKDNIKFKIIDSALETVLPKVRILIAGESGVAIEALAFGCNIISINVAEIVNMSPLRDVKASIVKNVTSPEELKEIVISTFETKHDAETYFKKAEEIVNEFFYFNKNSDKPIKFLELLLSTETISTSIH